MSTAENTLFQLKPTQIFQTTGSFAIGHDGKALFKISDLQKTYFEVLAAGHSIRGLVDYFLSQGWLVSFQQLKQLIDLLVSHQLVVPGTFTQAWSEYQQEIKVLTKSLSSSTTVSKSAIKELPFFRTLPEPIADLLLKNAKAFQMSPGTLLCEAGKSERSLFVVLSGKVRIYRNLGNNQRQLLNEIPAGSVFGEASFFLGTPRTADVIASETGIVVRIDYNEQFSNLINPDKASAIQQRFWVLHGLLSSSLFRELPSDTLDQLVHLGSVKRLAANQVLFKHGDQGREFYILVQGSVVITQGSSAINVMKPGDCFGEVALLVSQGRRTAGAHTQNESDLVVVPQQQFYQFLGQNLILAAKIEEIAHLRQTQKPG